MIKVMNTIKDFEAMSRRVVPKDNYYIVHLKVTNSIIEDVADVTKKLSTVPNVEKMPLVVYTSPFKDELWLLFSSVTPAEDHNLGGCHQELCSYFASLLSIELKGKIVKCWILELNSRIKVIEYFHSLVFMNMSRRVGNKNTTIEDAIENFPKEAWEKMPPAERYGVFYKLRSPPMSEEIDYKNIAKYQTYFFN
jgi:hypothetical protein